MTVSFWRRWRVRPASFRARRHAPGHQNSPPDCFYASHYPFRISHYIKKETATKVTVSFWRRWRVRPASFRARRHAPGHQNSPPDCFYASHYPFRISHYIKKETATKVTVSFWRRWRDSNSRGGCPPYALSRGASSPA